jgi:hypothetical protein
MNPEIRRWKYKKQDIFCLLSSYPSNEIFVHYKDKNNFAVEKSGRFHLAHLIKTNSTSNKSCW